jgi:hypothetical protein
MLDTLRELFYNETSIILVLHIFYCWSYIIKYKKWQIIQGAP